MRKTLLICLLILGCEVAGAQFIPMRKGAVLEYKYLDGKGRALRDAWRNERFLRMTVEDVWGDSVANVAIENEALKRLSGNWMVKDAVADLAYGDVRVTADGVTLDNMQWIFSGTPEFFSHLPEDMPEDESERVMPFGVDVDALHFLPAKMAAGDSLPEERYTVIWRENLTEKGMEYRREYFDEMREYMQGEFKGSLAMDLSFKAVIRNRRVEGLERVAVPAGEWECWKLSYEVVGPMEEIIGLPNMFRRETAPPVIRYVDYMSPEVGLVKREKLNYRGNKVEETMVLTSVK